MQLKSIAETCKGRLSFRFKGGAAYVDLSLLLNSIKGNQKVSALNLHCVVWASVFDALTRSQCSLAHLTSLKLMGPVALSGEVMSLLKFPENVAELLPNVRHLALGAQWLHPMPILITSPAARKWVRSLSALRCKNIQFVHHALMPDPEEPLLIAHLQLMHGTAVLHGAFRDNLTRLTLVDCSSSGLIKASDVDEFTHHNTTLECLIVLPRVRNFWDNQVDVVDLTDNEPELSPAEAIGEPYYTLANNLHTLSALRRLHMNAVFWSVLQMEETHVFYLSGLQSLHLNDMCECSEQFADIPEGFMQEHYDFQVYTDDFRWFFWPALADTLEHLVLQDCRNLPPNGLGRLHRLKTLSISRTRTGNVGLDRLMSVGNLQHPQLKHLELWDMMISKGALQQIAAMSQLARLVLVNCAFIDDCQLDVEAGLAMKHLQELRLVDCTSRVDDGRARALIPLRIPHDFAMACLESSCPLTKLQMLGQWPFILLIPTCKTVSNPALTVAEQVSLDTLRWTYRSWQMLLPSLGPKTRLFTSTSAAVKHAPSRCGLTQAAAAAPCTCGSLAVGGLMVQQSSWVTSLCALRSLGKTMVILSVGQSGHSCTQSG